jgi:hypothetical protein
MKLRLSAMAFILLSAAMTAGVPESKAAETCGPKPPVQIRVDTGHPWRPPFGLERVGRPLLVTAEITSVDRPTREYSLVGYLDGKTIGRFALALSEVKPLWTGDASFDVYPDRVVLEGKCRFAGEPEELASRTLEPPALEAAAVAHPDEAINPVDLGTILVPADWLLLSETQKGTVAVAAISRARDISGAVMRAWFTSNPQAKVSTSADLGRNKKWQANVALPVLPATGDHDQLHVEIADASGHVLWTRSIETMIFRNPPRWPEFGATKTRLRYDASISVRDVNTGELSEMKYADGWNPALQDVVVSLPNGSRFVFWRGSNYIPFWAGKNNAGLSYEWAETMPPPGEFVDSVEPLMDKELRYGRVEIIESTAARVHVRWTYQSCDFSYKVFGDAAFEDFYFYPDGFGTRVLNLKRTPGSDYELSEFIILSPAAAFPLDFLPRKILDILYLDGLKKEVTFPFSLGPGGRLEWPADLLEKSQRIPVAYRVKLHKDDTATAIYFSPFEKKLCTTIFEPFYDRGQLVTPVYWGSHWPLGRGKATGWSIDDRIYSSPAHNSVISWGMHNRPSPVRSSETLSVDTLGRLRPMLSEEYVWMIGMTDAPDARLLEWAQSFTTPPSLEVKGGRIEFESSSIERRSIRLTVLEPTVQITVKPTVKCVNPVFELEGAPASVRSVTLGGRALKASEYAWDGKTLWLNATISNPEAIRIELAGATK